MKEAQTLGILAVIAVCIILLCMWGGGRDLDRMYSDLQDGESADATQVDGSRGAVTDTSPSPVDPGLPAVTRHTTRTVREITEAERLDELESKQPRDIGFEPRADDEGADEDVAPEVAPEPVVHIVVKGETLSSISRRYYGSANKWQRILDANTDVVSDPRSLRPDMKLTIPEAKEDAAQVAEGREGLARPALAAGDVGLKTYTVQKGDNLWRIAGRLYGEGAQYKKILAANSDILTDPDRVKAGMVLVIP